MGALVSFTLPCALTMFVVWFLLLLAWWALAKPLGPVALSPLNLTRRSIHALASRCHEQFDRHRQTLGCVRITGRLKWRCPRANQTPSAALKGRHVHEHVDCQRNRLPYLPGSP